MQLIILIYNLTGASIKASISNHVQILIAAYLFLTGYGHFYYMWHRSDAGLTRYFQVKYNLLTLWTLLKKITHKVSYYSPLSFSCRV